MKIIFGILSFCLFLGWSYFLFSNRLSKIDDSVYQRIPFSNLKTCFFKIITNFACTKFFFVVCICLLLFLANKRYALVLSALMIINAGIVWLIKHIVRRKRPNIKRLVQEKGYSYPSGHTFSATCFYGFFLFTLWMHPLSSVLMIFITIGVVLFILLIGFSRIYLGVHYFSDVVGGFFISLSYLCFYVYFVYDVFNLL